jgi:hypothetical protein
LRARGYRLAVRSYEDGGVKLAILIVALLAPGGLILLAVARWRDRQAAKRDAAYLAVRIKPPRERFGKTDKFEMDSIHASAQRRRDHADDERLDAARIETGQPGEDRLRLISAKAKGLTNNCRRR